MQRRPLILGAAALAAARVGRAQPAPLLIGVVTTLEDSGLAKRLRSAFVADTGIAVHMTPGPSGKLLAQLQRGDLDVAITHAPDQENRLVQSGDAWDRRLVAHNDFLIVGPRVKGKDPAGIGGGKDAARALAKIAQTGAKFVARADNSGTHFKELALWKVAGIEPSGPWYIRSGVGMGDALAMANQLGAYLLVDRATWATWATPSGRRTLVPLVEGDARLRNVYHAMRAAKSKHPAAKLFLNWLTGPSGRRVIESLAAGSQPLFSTKPLP